MTRKKTHDTSDDNAATEPQEQPPEPQDAATIEGAAATEDRSLDGSGEPQPLTATIEEMAHGTELQADPRIAAMEAELERIKAKVGEDLVGLFSTMERVTEDLGGIKSGLESITSQFREIRDEFREIRAAWQTKGAAVSAEDVAKLAQHCPEAELVVLQTFEKYGVRYVEGRRLVASRYPQLATHVQAGLKLGRV